MSHTRSRKTKPLYRYTGKQNYAQELNSHHPSSRQDRNTPYQFTLTDGQRALFIGLTLMSLGAVVAGQYNRHQIQFTSKQKNSNTTFNTEVNFYGYGVKPSSACMNSQFNEIPCTDDMRASIQQNNITLSTDCHKVHGGAGTCQIDSISTNSSIALRVVQAPDTKNNEDLKTGYASPPIRSVMHYESPSNDGDIIDFHEALPNSETNVLLMERRNTDLNVQHISHRSTSGSTVNDVNIFLTKPNREINFNMKVGGTAEAAFDINLPANKDVRVIAKQQGGTTIIQAGEVSDPLMKFPENNDPVTNAKPIKTITFFAKIKNEKESITEFVTDESNIQIVRRK